MILPINVDAARKWSAGEPIGFLRTPAVEMNPQFSPDGRWIAYMGGCIYVRPFPARPGNASRVSSVGSFPSWSPAGSQLLYIDGTTNQVMVVPFTVSGSTFRPGDPVPWAPGGSWPVDLSSQGAHGGFAVHPDGKRIVLASGGSQTGVANDKLVFVFNFGEYLRTLLQGAPK